MFNFTSEYEKRKLAYNVNVINTHLAYIRRENVDRFAIAFGHLNISSMIRAFLYSSLSVQSFEITISVRDKSAILNI